MPAGAAASPRRVPPGVLALLVRLPEREVARVLLEHALLLFLGRVAHRRLVVVTARQAPVVGIAVDAEIDVAAGFVGEAQFDELLDQGDDLRDRPGRERLVIRAAEAEQVGVLDVPARGVGGESRAVAGGSRVDLVVDVGDVLHQRHVVAALLEPAAEPHGDDERPRVPHMDSLVDGRPAEVHADRALAGLGELDEATCGRVIEPHRPSGEPRRWGARRSRPTARGRALDPSAQAATRAGRLRPPSARARCPWPSRRSCAAP